MIRREAKQAQFRSYQTLRCVPWKDRRGRDQQANSVRMTPMAGSRRVAALRRRSWRRRWRYYTKLSNG